MIGRNRSSQQQPHHLEFPRSRKEVLTCLNQWLKDKEVIEQEYDTLQEFTRESLVGDTEKAEDGDNRSKNRYKDILPYGWRGVKIMAESWKPGEEPYKYINASWILFKDFNLKFIASQAPLEGTIPDFWQCVAEHEVEAIVMLTSLIENGKAKSAQYWPDTGTELFGEHTVSISSQEEYECYTLRILILQCKDGTKRDITHIQVKDWGDFSVPATTKTLMDLVQKVKVISCRPETFISKKVPPLMVHCSAGVGRTGTFIATYKLSSTMVKRTLFSRPSVWDTVLTMREARPKMVQKKEQYIYVFQCLRDIMEGEEQNKNLSANNISENNNV